MEPSVEESTFFSAATGQGQRGEEPKEGTLRTLILSLFCKVLDHLMIMWIPGGAIIISPVIIVLKDHKKMWNEGQD